MRRRIQAAARSSNAILHMRLRQPAPSPVYPAVGLPAAGAHVVGHAAEAARVARALLLQSAARRRGAVPGGGPGVGIMDLAGKQQVGAGSSSTEWGKQ